MAFALNCNSQRVEKQTLSLRFISSTTIRMFVNTNFYGAGFNRMSVKTKNERKRKIVSSKCLVFQ
jgi:hypothetical protein